MSITGVNTRNQLRGTVVNIRRGSVVSEVEIETAVGIVSAVVTTSSVDRLPLREGDPALALFVGLRVLRMGDPLPHGLEEILAHAEDSGPTYRVIRNQEEDIHVIACNPVENLLAIGTDAGTIPLSARFFENTVNVPVGTTMDMEFVADNPGLTLFHCHQQLHMDFGFMTLFDYI